MGAGSNAGPHFSLGDGTSIDRGPESSSHGVRGIPSHRWPIATDGREQ
jgi:hypothetical protein